MTAGFLVAVFIAAACLLFDLPSRRISPASRLGAPADVGGITDAPLVLDLLASVLSSGGSVEHALVVVSESCETGLRESLARVHAARRLGASWESAWDSGTPGGQALQNAQHGPGAGSGRRRMLESSAVLADVQHGLRFATSTGAPSAALLHAHAAQLRRRRNRDVDRRAAALGVQLVLPLGLCALPAFICLGVVPVVLGLLPSF